MPSLHITTSGGLLTNQFVEAIQQPAFSHPALATESFAMFGRKAPTPAELERAIGTAWELLIERWDGIEPGLAEMDISALRTRWLQPLFTLLDFALEYQRADLVLDEDQRFPISYLARPASLETAPFIPVHTVLPNAEGLDARREGSSALKRLSPHDLLQRYLNISRDSLWGILSDGLRLRLLRDYRHTYTRGYVEFDLQGIFSTRDFAAFRALYRLCHASRFTPMPGAAPAPAPKKASAPAADDEAEGEEGEPEETPPTLTALESFYQTALATGVRVGEDLRKSVRAAIETLANGFLQSTPGLLAALQAQGSDGARRLYVDVLHVIYRVLFLMFAEQRGMLPGRGSLYMDEFSLTALRARAERPAGDDPHFDLWERLKTTFRMVECGVPALGVFGYNGVLFGQAHLPLLTPASGDAPRLGNASLLAAIKSLATIERDGTLQRISYIDVSVEEIGSVYESLLDYTARIAAITETVEKREVAAGQFFLDPRGKERKTTGSYYTHPSLVNQLIQTALLPTLADRLAQAVPGWDQEHPELLTPDQRSAAADALLSLRVVDPACGSGAFLIAANNALGLALAKITSGDPYPSEAAVRAARRDALAHCIYGVDLNPLAVELCKVSLWINAAVPDRKLNFLDHHIRCGNSLVGATYALVSQGIPDGAYDPVTGDDKPLAASFKRINRDAKTGQSDIWWVTDINTLEELHQYLDLTRLAEDDPAAAERCFHDLSARSGSSTDRLAFDLWTAAFFWPHAVPEDERNPKERARAGIQARRTSTLQPPCPTTRDIAHVRGAPALLDDQMVAYARQLAAEQRFFHWELEFPEVFSAGKPGGFDVVLGNPPWEMVNLEEKQFFEPHDSAITNAPTGAARKALIQKLPITNPALWMLYSRALREAEQIAKFTRASGRYDLTAKGRINTYSIFAEHDRDLLARKGRCGVILPTGIATDYTNKDFFADLVERGQIASLYDFENRRAIFPGVHRSFKFCMLTLRRADSAGDAPEFAFFLLAVDDLQDPERRFTLTSEDFARINPNTRTAPIFRTRSDAALTRKLYEAAPVLVNEATGENPWGVSFMQGLFNMTSDSHLFRTRAQMEQAGFTLLGNRFVKGSEVYLPLYEGRLGFQYTHRYATQNIDEIHELSTIELVDPDKQIETQFYVPSHETSKLLAQREFLCMTGLLGFRRISSNTNERTIVATIFPWGAASYGWIISSGPSSTRLSLLLGIYNSFVFDYLARNKISQASIPQSTAEQLPCLSISNLPLVIQKTIIPISLEMIIPSWDLISFADDVWKDADISLRQQITRQWEENAAATGGGHRGAARPDWAPAPDSAGFPYPPFKWDEARRAQLRAELDGLFAHLYGLHRDELAYILDTFPIVRRKDEAAFGEFRTKRLVLEAYDRLVGSELIPPEAQERSKHSVLGEKAVSAPAPKPAPPKPVVALPQQGSTALTQPNPVPPAPPVEAKPEPTAQPELADFRLYKCQRCGKHVMGYDKANHTRDAHAGIDPGYSA